MVDYTKRPPSGGGNAAGGGGVSLNKRMLTKAAPTVSLSKQGATMSGELRVNLNWTARPADPRRRWFPQAAGRRDPHQRDRP